MEVADKDVVIVGAGIAGLTTALGLYRHGIESLVLESSADLRVTGFSLTTWTNAWKALDAVGIAHSLRNQFQRIHGMTATSLTTGQSYEQMSFLGKGKHGEHEIRCVGRKLLLETLAKELPHNTIKFSSKVVSIEESGYFKLVHLADGTIIKTKVLIGCDGVNSIVAKWLGFKQSAYAGRAAIRGYAHFKDNHGYDPKFMLFIGNGFRGGLLPCDESTIYWFFTWSPPNSDKKLEDNPCQMKQFVLSKLESDEANPLRAVIEATELDSIIASHLRYRHPWELVWGNISKGNVCVAGDALHPMTPDIGQGGCSALEDGIVLARCLAETFKGRQTQDKDKEEYNRIEIGLKKYAQERRWRSIDLITTAYLVGFIEQSNDKILNFLRDIVLAKFLGWLRLKGADFDCGRLNIS